MATQVNTKKSNPINELQNLLYTTKSDLCGEWENIKANNEEIKYKKSHIDDKYEYFTAKAALFQSSDSALSDWAKDHETIYITSSEFSKKLKNTFSKKEYEEYVKLIHVMKDEKIVTTKDGGYTYINKHINKLSPEDSIKYQHYVTKLETMQCDLWKAPYELISTFCYHDDF